MYKGPAGFALLVYFTINAMFSGTRLGLCWIMITERFPEFLEGVSYPKLQCSSCVFHFSVETHTWSLQKRQLEKLEGDLE